MKNYLMLRNCQILFQQVHLSLSTTVFENPLYLCIRQVSSSSSCSSSSVFKKKEMLTSLSPSRQIHRIKDITAFLNRFTVSFFPFRFNNVHVFVFILLRSMSRYKWWIIIFSIFVYRIFIVEQKKNMSPWKLDHLWNLSIYIGVNSCIPLFLLPAYFCVTDVHTYMYIYIYVPRTNTYIYTYWHGWFSV